MKFELLNTDNKARLGIMNFARGNVDTPAFMPVGTYGAVKAMTVDELKEVGAQIILGNAFHLSITPGVEAIQEHGKLHNFINWHKPILIDSGGFQVFSLGDIRKISEKGVSFRSPKDGDKIFIDKHAIYFAQFCIMFVDLALNMLIVNLEGAYN